LEYWGLVPCLYRCWISKIDPTASRGRAPGERPTRREALKTRGYPHPTSILFKKIWPAVKAEAKRSRSLSKALRRADLIMAGIPNSEADGANIIREALRYRFATVDAPLVGGPTYIADHQRSGRAPKRLKSPS
jgi:hypothetical protein